MKTPLELTQQQRYDIVSYRMENAQKTLGEIEALVALKYYNTASNRGAFVILRKRKGCLIGIKLAFCAVVVQ
jgi:hypothetical protein